MHVRTLGRAELSASGTRLGPESPVAFPLLLHLVLERDRWVARTQLQEMLFPEQDRLHARHSLRQSVYVLRKDGFPIEGSGPAVHIPAKAIVDDYSTLLTPQLEGERELSDLMGGWLAGFEPTISLAYSHWFEGKRSEIAVRMRTALLAELALHKRNARWAQCERTCRAILSLDPLNEEATLGLAEALALTGAKVQAIRVLERYQEEMPNADLRLPASILRRRISERLPLAGGASREAAFVGRSDEMRVVADLLDAARSSSAGGLIVTGEPGIGKTRILREVEALGAVAGFQTLTHVCHPHDTARPMGVISPLAQRLRQLPGALGCAPQALSLINRLQDPPPATAMHELLAVDSQDLTALMGWAVQELVAAVVSEIPLIFSIDDVHWADDASVSVLLRIIGAVTGPLVLLLAGRHAPEMMKGPANHLIPSLPLKPLGPGDASALLDAEFSATRGDKQAAFEWVQSNSGGNPLFIVTLARHASAHPEDRTLPKELVQLLEHRLSDLSAADSRVLAAICALGRRATFSNVEQVLGLPRHELLSSLDLLDSQGFATTKGDALAATHPLIAEGVLQKSSDSSRKYLFHTAAGVLQSEALQGDDPTLMWDAISLVKRSGASGQVVGAARRCAQHALSIGRATDACDLLLDARASVSAADSVSLTEDLLSAAVSAGRWALVADCAARLMLESRNSRLTVSQLQWLSTEAEWHRGHRHQQLCARLQEQLADANLPVEARLRIADFLCIAGSNTGDANAAKIASAFAKTVVHRPHARPEALGILLVYEATFGDMRAAKEYALNVLNLTEGELPTHTTLRLRNNAAACLRFAGEMEASLAHLERAYHDALKHGLVGNAYGFAHELAFAYLTRCDLTASKSWIDEAERLIAISGDNVDPYGVTEAQTLHAMLRRDSDAAESLLSDLKSISEPRSTRLRAFAEALSCLANLRAGREGPSDVQFAYLMEQFQSARKLLEADFFAWTMFELLSLRGEAAAGAALVQEYVSKYRRDRSPLLPPLSDVVGINRG